MVDHVSDSFLEPDTPLLMLLAAAREGHEKEVEEFGEIFTDHASKLVEVANLACSMSNHEDGVKMVRYAAAQIETLCPQVLLRSFFIEYRYWMIHNLHRAVKLFFCCFLLLGNQCGKNFSRQTQK